MKFTTNTKPLQEALNLGVIRKSVTNFYQKSMLAQLTCTKDTLKVNLETNCVLTEFTLKGSGDEDTTAVVFVNCVILSDLMNTFDSPTVTIEYVDGGIILHSGKSQFTLSQEIDDTDLTLATPSEIDPEAEAVELDKKLWKFIDDHQMFARSMSFVPPVYTYVYAAIDGDIFVGDMVNSIFTHSTKNNFKDTFLLSDTVINLLTSFPDGCKATKTVDGCYQINVTTDSFSCCAQFEPTHENDETGEYSAEIIKKIVAPDKDNSIAVSLPQIQKFLSQATLLDNDANALITIEANDKTLTIKDNNVNCELPLKSAVAKPFDAVFKTKFVKSIFSHMDQETINLSPRFSDEDGEEVTSGIIFWTDELSVVLGSVEQI